MKTFVPFEDDWGPLEQLDLVQMIPYRPGLRCGHAVADASAAVVSLLPNMARGPAVATYSAKAPGSAPE